MRRKSNESKECSTYPKDILAPWGLKSFWNKMLKCEAYTFVIHFATMTNSQLHKLLSDSSN